MDVTLTTNQNDVTLVQVQIKEERITAITVSPVRMELAKILKFHKTGVLLDFSYVQFIDSMGLSLIFSAVRACRQYGTEAKLVHVNDQPKLTLTLAGVDEIIEIYDDLDEAIQSFQKLDYSDPNH